MALGARVRQILGDRWSRKVGALYRAIFADMALESKVICEIVPPNAHVLDVGVGDGVPLNALLGARPDISAVAIDTATKIGQWIDPAHQSRVVCIPETTLDAYMLTMTRPPDAILICDVLHHVPVTVRDRFFSDLGRLMSGAPHAKLIVKDVEPGYFRARLGYLADVYITGDKGVSPVGRAQVREWVLKACPGLVCEETILFSQDCPNYALVFRR